MTAPKPESAEAVGLIDLLNRVATHVRHDNELWQEVMGTIIQLGITTPPRPEASAPFGECGCGKPVNYFDVMGRPSCNKRIRCSEQQASAPDATSIAVDEAMERDARYWRTLITKCKRDHIWYHVLPPDLTGKHDSIESVLDSLAGRQQGGTPE